MSSALSVFGLRTYLVLTMFPVNSSIIAVIPGFYARRKARCGNDRLLHERENYIAA